MTTQYTTKQLETFAQAWNDQFARERGWENHRLGEPIDHLRTFFQHIPGKIMMDVGCGWGRYVNKFVAYGLDYLGMDLSEEMLRVSRITNPGQQFIQGTYRKIPFSNQHFDGLWSCCSLSAVPKSSLVSVLNEHYRVVTEGGIVMIILPSLAYSDEELLTDDDGKPTLHQSHYVLPEFHDFIRETKFDLIDAEDGYYSPGTMSFLLRR